MGQQVAVNEVGVVYGRFLKRRLVFGCQLGYYYSTIAGQGASLYSIARF